MNNVQRPFTDNGSDSGIATRVYTGGGFSENGIRESGSRYEDKRIRDAGLPAGKKRGTKKRPKKNSGRRLFAVLTVALAVLIVCAAAAIVINIRSERERSGFSQEDAQDGGLSQAEAQDGSGSFQGGSQNSPEADAAGDGLSAGGEGTQGDDSQAAAPSAGDAQQGDPEGGSTAQDGDGSSAGIVDLGILDSPYAVLMDAESGEPLAAKRSEEKIFPASMTKILTVLVAIEHIPDLDETIHMSEDFYEQLYEEDASRAGFEPGEPAKIRDLLYGALLPSGAECCIQLARQAAGSESAFVDLMNQKAADLGLVQTKFVNCTGLHDAEQFSTCTEIAKILRAAIQNETFFDVFTTHHYSVDPNDIHPEGFTFWSTLFKATVDEIVTGGEIIGGKTGFTEEAGHCLASAARIYDHIYILVTAGWGPDPENEMYHINDAFRAYDALGSALS